MGASIFRDPAKHEFADQLQAVRASPMFRYSGADLQFQLVGVLVQRP
jgi:hypothetical protein